MIVCMCVCYIQYILNQQTLDQVKEFRYLGSIITEYEEMEEVQRKYYQESTKQ